MTVVVVVVVARTTSGVNIEVPVEEEALVDNGGNDSESAGGGGEGDTAGRRGYDRQRRLSVVEDRCVGGGSRTGDRGASSRRRIRR